MATMVDVSVGQVISLLDGRQATVRFVGATHFASGDWIGVELDDATGKNDGSVQGERYFDCEHGFGMFIRPSAVASVLAPAPAPKRESKVAAAPTKAAAVVKGPTSGAAALKRTGSAATAASKRQSVTASPSPAPREIAARNLRVKSRLRMRPLTYLLTSYSHQPSLPLSNSALPPDPLRHFREQHLR